MLLGHNIEQGQRTRDVRIYEDITFDSMLLASNTLEGLKSSGFHKPSPIQLHGIPLGKCGFDLLLEAKSGTGKTAVFTIIALEKLDFENSLQAVILAPTREIAAQICDVIKQVGSYYNALKVEVVMGGLPIQEDISKFKKKTVHIVVGSPGRLRHLIQEKYINTSAVRLLVLDEADKLMEKSFQADINYIFSVLPKQKQVIMSSATYPETTRLFIDRYVQNAQHIQPDINSVLLGVEQKVTTVKYNTNIVKQTKLRFEELLKILSKKPFKQCLIFCNYQARVKELYKMLIKEKWPVEQLYGQQEQIDRLDAIKTLQEYKCRILISTDLAARGIDASNVDLVINFELPGEWQTYLHRIGRAGRFGSYGIAITILSKDKEEKKFKEMLDILNVSSNNLWDEECVYTNDDLDTSLSSQISQINNNEPLAANNNVEEKCKKLWDMFTYNNTIQKKREIDTFETLCKSFKESKADSEIIEPFTALVNSFQCYQHEENINEENNSYGLINQVMSVKECFAVDKSANKKTKSNKKTQCINSHQNSKDFRENGKNSEHLVVSNNNDISVSSSINEIDAREINDSEVTWPFILESYFENYELSNPRYSDEPKYETPDLTEALRRAGLPTSFGNQKVRFVEPKKYYKKRNRDKNNLTEYSDDEDYNHHKDYPEKYTQNIKSLKTKVSSEYSYQADQKYFPSSSNDFTADKSSPDTVSNDYDTLSHQYRFCHSNASYTKHANVDDQDDDDLDEDDEDEDDQDDDDDRDDIDKDHTKHANKVGTSAEELSQYYLHWYKEFNKRINQIEQAAYIDELSKI